MLRGRQRYQKAEDVKQFFDRPRWGDPHAPKEQPVQWLWNSATAFGEGRENDLASLFRLLHDTFPTFDSQSSRHSRGQALTNFASDRHTGATCLKPSRGTIEGLAPAPSPLVSLFLS